MDDEIMRYRDKLIRQAQNLPIWERKCLTVDEAAEYSGIGRKKLRSLLKKKNCPFALSDGFQLLIIREKLDAVDCGHVLWNSQQSLQSSYTAKGICYQKHFV